MGLFDFSRKPASADEDAICTRLMKYVLDFITEEDGRVRVEDAISAAATIVAERCIDAADDFSLRDHELTPGSYFLSTKVNDLICGDVAEVSQLPAHTIVAILRARLKRGLYSDSDFPDLPETFRHFVAHIGEADLWGKVALSVPEGNLPFILPIQLGYETRDQVDKILLPFQDNKRRCLRIATEALADILSMAASSTEIDRKQALTLAIETINGMAKTAPMTERAMRQAQETEK